MAERKRVVILAYRHWAKQAATDIMGEFVDDPEWQFDQFQTEQQAESIGGRAPTAILAIGWSWRVEQSWADRVPVLRFHPSPLPRYRGRSPIQHQMLAGEATSALSIVDAGHEAGGWDMGPLYWQRAFSLEGTLADVLGRITSLSAEGGISALRALADDSFATQAQMPSDMETLKQREPKESEITPEMLSEMSGQQLFDFIRAQQPPYPTAFVRGNDGAMVLLDTRPTTRDDIERHGVIPGSGVLEGRKGQDWKRSIEAARARASE